ncbi:MAG: hypothetical protein K6G76_08650 [Lachnospiraceae bacterium]|nr:hypothetical protein [Lachnospiraceae bacterium]
MFKKYLSMFREDMRYAMERRCGQDELNNFIMLIGFVFVMIALFSHKWVFVLLGFAFVLVCYLRVFSKNLDARRKENDLYMRYMGKTVEFSNYVKLVVKMYIRSLKDKEYMYFVCSNCKQVIRLPKGKNKVSVRCPKCSSTYVKRT